MAFVPLVLKLFYRQPVRNQREEVVGICGRLNVVCAVAVNEVKGVKLAVLSSYILFLFHKNHPLIFFAEHQNKFKEIFIKS